MRPVLTLLWPLDGMKLSGDMFTVNGVVDDPTATITVALVDTNGATNLYSGLVERDGTFWVEDLPLSTGTSLLSLVATDAWGNTTTTNISVLKSEITITVNPVPEDQLWNETVSVSGTISDPSYSVWVNGVAATVRGDGTWTADQVPVNHGRTARFTVTAYPEGTGPAGGGGGAIPPSSSTTEHTFFVDKPDRFPYVARYEENVAWDGYGYDEYDYFYFGAVQWWEVDEKSKRSHCWADGQGGNGNSSDYFFYDSDGGIISSYQCQRSMQWPASYWPELRNGTQDCTGDCSGESGAIGPPYVGWEHCGVSYRNTDEGMYWCEVGGFFHWGRSESKHRRNAQTIMKLYTGGKAIAGRKSLWVITASADEILDRPAWRPHADSAKRRIEPQDIVIDGKHVGTDGLLYVAWPEGVTKDVTPRVDGIEFYTFNVGANKHRPVILANGYVLNPDRVHPGARYCVGQKIVFTLQFCPGLPSSSVQKEKHTWYLPPKYVNAWEEWNTSDYYITTCHPERTYLSRGPGFGDPPDEPHCKRYSIVDWPLKELETGAWWVSGGPKIVSCYVDLNFSNGQKVSLDPRGQFHMVKPHVTRVDPNPPFGGGIDRSGWPPYLTLMDNPMCFNVYISKTYPGKFGISQLVRMSWETYFPAGPFPIPWGFSTGEAYWLDSRTGDQFYDGLTDINLDPATFPSDEEYPVPTKLYDAPGCPLYLIYGTYHGNWKSYVMFLPQGAGSIPITLERIDWSWTSFTSQNLDLTWSDPDPDSVADPRRHSDDTFPEWDKVYSPWLLPPEPPQ